MAAKSAIERSVKSLQGIYAIIIALAMGQAINTLIKVPSTAQLRAWIDISPQLPAFAAFVALLVPFYHGMNRHLEICYIEKTTKVVKPALPIDFVVFFLESALLFAFAVSLDARLESFIVLGILLIFDCVWAITSHLIHYRGLNSTIGWWALLNVITVLLGFLIYNNQMYTEETKLIVLMFLSFARTGVDYWICRGIYFPK
jgi:hypothetical protein